MTVAKLLSENDPFLSAPVADYDPSHYHPLRDIAELLEATRKAHNALGLAANQCGYNIRMFVMGTEFANFVCVNPKIIEESSVITAMNEGCLSFPGLRLSVQRPETITVSYLDVDLKEVTCEFKGNLAKCFQHELDHLNGITFNKRVSKLVLAMAAKKRAVKRRFR